jgi:Fic family protein
MTHEVEAFTPLLERRALAEVMRLVGEIDEFKGHWRKLKEIRAERLAQLRQVTTIESAGSSTRIEGAELSNAEVARVLKGLSVESFRARDESEVRGYGDLLQVIFDSHSEVELTENYIQQLHKILLKHSAKDARHRGRYKTQENHVEARHPDGRREVLFRTATPFDTPFRMRDLVATTREAFAHGAAHPLVVIARFVVEFLAIHPFQDGNGRLSRALTTLLLLKQGYDYVPYSSLERVVEENKAAYYAALRHSQAAMREDASDFGAWLLFLLRALQAQKRGLEAKLELERSFAELSEVQQRILEVVDAHGRVTTTLLASTLGIPMRTLRYHLGVLAEQRVIEPHGERKGRYYTRAGSDAAAPTPVLTPMGAILGEVLQRGGRISRNELVALVKRHGYDARAVGSMHGRRLAHLRRDPATGDSALTSRGREIAQQHLFSARLSSGSKPISKSKQAAAT